MARDDSGVEHGHDHRLRRPLALHVLDLMESAIRASDEGAHVEIGTTCERPAALPAGLGDDRFDD